MEPVHHVARRRGSSPLARGLRRDDGPECLGIGIIPARAGFTLVSPAGASPSEDHPRSRGVYWAPFTAGPCGAGSSPLARGLLDAAETAGDKGRIIPARAGFTARRRRIGTNGGGSSPLARGLRTDIRLEQFRDRIIPARAGFTLAGRVTAYSLPGSSPLARGLRRHRQGAVGLLVDHPRSRGVYDQRVDAPVEIQGSSPLARGLPHIGGHGGTQIGIIPARAGFTMM